MKILGKIWFNPGGGMKVIGIVRVENEIGIIKYYIGTGDGRDEEEDTEHIANYGAKFPKRAGDELFL
jgi:hypothetical protein